MRPDFAQLLTERPRRQAPLGYDRSRRTTKRGDPEEAPFRQSMKRDLTDRKHLNENLNPLQRFLQKNVGRSWNKVYAELHEHVNPRSAVQAHIFEHLFQYVERTVKLDTDGFPLVPGDNHTWQPIANFRRLGNFGLFFVHPKTGILTAVPRSRRPLKRAKPTGHHQLANDRECIVRKAGPYTDLEVLVKEDGIWYFVRMGPVPQDTDNSTEVYDYLLSWRSNAYLSKVAAFYGSAASGSAKVAYKRLAHDCVHAIGRGKQLNSKELRERGLTNNPR